MTAQDRPTGGEGPVRLRPYQEQAVAELRALVRRGARRIIIAAATGSGKTTVAGHLICRAAARGRRSLFIAHRRELINQAYGRLLQMGLPEADVGVIMARDPRRRPGAHVQVASIDTLRNRPKPRSDVVFIDECLPAGTLVDGRPIETLQVGDAVLSFSHTVGQVEKRRITHVFCSRPRRLVSVHFEDGRRLTCTPSHPVFTPAGYVPAGLLNPHDIVARSRHGHQPQDLCRLREDLRPAILELEDDPAVLACLQGEAPRSSPEEGHGSLQAVRQDGYVAGSQGSGAGPDRRHLLLRCVQTHVDQRALQKDDGEAEPSHGLPANEGAQPDARHGYACEGIRHPKVNGVGTDATRGKRPGSDGAPENPQRSARLANGGRRLHKDAARERLPDQLQARHRGTGADGRHRDRRFQPLQPKTAGARREEGGVLDLARVDRVEVHERGSDGRFGGLCPDGCVYNLEVDGNHNYFANGILTHNCHRALARSYRDLAARYPDAIHVGLTATPYRADGRGLGDMYDELVPVSSPRELIRLGYLVEPRVFTVPRDALPNLSGVRVRRGDYHESELAEAVDRKHLVGNIVEHWLRHARDLRTVAFAVSVRHSQHIAEQFRQAGVPAEHLDGTTPLEERDAILGRLEAGETRVVSNVGVLCEGWDQPSVKCAILARPTKSTGLYLQQAGRILRPWDDLQAVILDHAGCALEHGLPQDDRAFSLDSAKKRRKGAAGVGPPLKTCEQCFAVVHTATRLCPECGFVFAPPQEVPEEASGDLVEVTAATVSQQRAAWQGLCAVAARRGFKPGWAYHRYRERFGSPPPASFALEGKRRRRGTEVSVALREAVRGEGGRVSWDTLSGIGEQ